MDRGRRIAVWATAAVLVVLVGALVLGVGGGGSDDGDGAGGPPGATQPDSNVAAVGFARFDGTKGSFADYEGRPLVVNFFAEWCAPCVDEMPAIERVHQRYDSNVGFIGMNLRDPVKEGRKVVRATGVTYDLARDPDGRIYDRFTDTGVMPVTALVDSDGDVVEVHHGRLSEKELDSLVREKLLQ